MPVSDAQKKATKKYLEGLDEIRVRAKGGTKARWKAAAESRGQSLNQFIVEAVEADMVSPHSAQERPQEGGGLQLSPDALKAAQEAAQAAGEAVPQFIERAVATQVERDKRSWKMGINPATREKETPRA